MMDFLQPTEEETVSLFLPRLQVEFGAKAVEGAGKAKLRCDVAELDGNANTRRAVCAAALASSSYCPHLQRTLHHTCSKTPAFGRYLCPMHRKQDDAPDGGLAPWHHFL